MIRIRAFRAVDDTALCTRFAEGHARVLHDYGITKVTSSSTDWFYNPSVYALIAENQETDETVGGVRIHIADEKVSLPMEDAISFIDQKVIALVKEHIPTGELCGLWNSKSVAGIGLGSYFLMRAGISITEHLGLPTLLALCAPHTYNISIEKGFEIEKSIGNEGTFLYPKFDLIASTIIIKDTINLPKALPEERKLIFELRKHPAITRKEIGPKGELEIMYNLNF